MDVQSISVALTGAGVLSGLVLYVIRAEQQKDVSRLDGRLNQHEAECEQRQKNADERHDRTTEMLAHMDGKLDRLIEGRR